MHKPRWLAEVTADVPNEDLFQVLDCFAELVPFWLEQGFRVFRHRKIPKNTRVMLWLHALIIMIVNVQS